MDSRAVSGWAESPLSIRYESICIKMLPCTADHRHTLEVCSLQIAKYWFVVNRIISWSVCLRYFVIIMMFSMPSGIYLIRCLG